MGLIDTCAYQKEYSAWLSSHTGQRLFLRFTSNSSQTCPSTATCTVVFDLITYLDFVLRS